MGTDLYPRKRRDPFASSPIPGRRIPVDLAAAFTPALVQLAWEGVVKYGGGHRSLDLKYPQVVERVCRFVQTEGSGREPWQVASKVLYAFAYEQPYGDCNRRTGWVLAYRLMEAAGYRLARSEDQVVEYLSLFATNFPSEEAFTQWLRESFA
jgi:prophage maintenance system killer protein